MTDNNPSACLAFSRHDHGDCLASGMAYVRQHCTDNGLRLTKTRQRVLEILLESHKALGAYDILNRLADEGLGSQPPVVYRALDFLTEHGFVHRLERLNAFTACVSPKADHEAMFLICQDCRVVAEASQSTVANAMDRAARDLGFAVTSRIIEVIGYCPDCQTKVAP